MGPKWVLLGLAESYVLKGVNGLNRFLLDIWEKTKKGKIIGE